jgi:hypothetical protein
MIINTELPKNLDEYDLILQEKILSEILQNIRKAEDRIQEKLGIVRGKLSTKK